LSGYEDPVGGQLDDERHSEFGEVISLVDGAWVPKNVILPLLLVIMEPIESHIHSLA